MSNSDKTQQNNDITETAGEPFPSQRIWRNKILTTITKSTMKVPMFSRGNAQSTRTQHITTNKENYPIIPTESTETNPSMKELLRLEILNEDGNSVCPSDNTEELLKSPQTDTTNIRRKSYLSENSTSTDNTIRLQLKLSNIKGDPVGELRQKNRDHHRQRRDSARESIASGNRGIPDQDLFEEESGVPVVSLSSSTEATAALSEISPMDETVVKAPAVEPKPESMSVQDNTGSGSSGMDKTRKFEQPESSTAILPSKKSGAEKRKRKQKSKTERQKESDTSDCDTEAVKLTDPDKVFKKGDPLLTLIVTKAEALSDACDHITRLLFVVSHPLKITLLQPTIDGARIEVEDKPSAITIAETLRREGWTVTETDVWNRYQFPVPFQLSGLENASDGLDPVTLVRGLISRNVHYGLPLDSIRYVSHAWETVKVEAADGSTAGARRRMRLWVDVSPQGEVYLVKTGHLLCTLTAAVRLREAPRNRTFRRNRS